MKLNEALKAERLAQGKTQSEWLTGVDLSVSRYSEIESGKARNGKVPGLDSGLLVALLTYNNVNIQDFFAKIQDSYISDQSYLKLAHLSDSLSSAYENSDLLKVSTLKNEIFAIDSAPKVLKYKANLLEADLKDHMQSLDSKIRQKISNYLYEHSNWVEDVDALRIFGNSMPIMEEKLLVVRMRKILNRYADIKTFPEDIQRRISTICINYLYNALFVFHTQKNVNESLILIKRLPNRDTLAMKKIVGKYFEDVLVGNMEDARRIKEVLEHSGLTILAKKLPL